MKALIKFISIAALFLVFAALAVLGWRQLQLSSLPPAPCPEELPGGLDPSRVVVVAIDGPSAHDFERTIFRQDLEELLLAGRYQPVSAGGAAGGWAPHCVGWRLGLSWKKTLAAASLNEAKVFLTLSRAGRIVEERSEKPRPDTPALLPELRRAIAARLEIAGAGRNASLHDPASPGFEDRVSGMRLQAQGRLREAVETLAAAAARDPADAVLAYHLGSLLGDWGGDLLVNSSRPPWSGARPLLHLAVDARQKLDGARLHLERSLELEGRSAPALLARGRLRSALGEKGAAEDDLRASLALWPSCCEAVRDLAALQLARNDADGLEQRLGEALELLDSGLPALRAELLYQLGQVRAMRGDLRTAADTFEQALAAAPAERRLLQHQLRKALAEAQEKLGETPR